MKYKAAIFDMDGTILDTLEDLCHTLDYTLEHFGFPKKTVPEMRSYLGNGMRNFIQLGAPAGTSEALREEMFQVFAEYYKTHCAIATKTYAGLLPMLDRLKAEGMKIAVVSNKGDFGVQILCDEYFPKVFHYAVGEKTGISKKPAPDMVNACLKEFGLKPEEAVYIGDSEVDLETARNAGMDEVLVTWGFRDREFLEERGGKVIVDTMEELEKQLIVKR